MEFLFDIFLAQVKAADSLSVKVAHATWTMLAWPLRSPFASLGANLQDYPRHFPSTRAATCGAKGRNLGLWRPLYWSGWCECTHVPWRAQPSALSSRTSVLKRMRRLASSTTVARRRSRRSKRRVSTLFSSIQTLPPYRHPRLDAPWLLCLGGM